MNVEKTFLLVEKIKINIDIDFYYTNERRSDEPFKS